MKGFLEAKFQSLYNANIFLMLLLLCGAFYLCLVAIDKCRDIEYHVLCRLYSFGKQWLFYSVYFTVPLFGSLLELFVDPGVDVINVRSFHAQFLGEFFW